MGSYRVIALPESVAREVRDTGRSPRYGHPAPSEVANGYGPCRHCLRFFRRGEERRILFTYDPFDGTESLPLPGPVFIHEASCARYPEDGGFPQHLGEHRLTLQAYGRGRSLRAEEHVGDGRIEPALERLLSRPDVDYIHVRDTGAGCYDLRIERA
jgi:hypothetical protein